MKVPNFKGVQVCSKYDGRGVIERVFVDRNIHFAIKFQSNQTKNFFVPMAFNSGLLSTGNTQLNEYLQTLNQDDNFKKIVRPNDDIPTPTDLKITITGKYALTRHNLALLGALDDFYQLYVDVYDFIIQQMVEHTKKIFEDNHKEYHGEIQFYFPDSLKPQLRKLFEPTLNKYLHLFTNEYTRIFATAYDFHLFTYIQVRGRQYMLVPFDDFCKSIENVYVNSFYKRKCNQNSNVSQETVFKQVNTRIQILSAVAQKKIFVQSNSASPEADSTVLYVIRALSCTLCYQQQHYIEAKAYVASLANSDRFITLPVHFCTVCHRYFIGDKTLHEYEKTYGEILVMKQRYKDETLSSVDFFNDFNQESLLHQYGYNVRIDGLPESTRRNLLISLIEKKLLSYHEICRTIEQNISLFQGNPQYSQAVTKWKSDLKFIGDYVKSKS